MGGREVEFLYRGRRVVVSAPPNTELWGAAFSNVRVETSNAVRPVNECRNIRAGHLAHGDEAVLSNPSGPKSYMPAAVGKAVRL